MRGITRRMILLGTCLAAMGVMLVTSGCAGSRSAASNDAQPRLARTFVLTGVTGTRTNVGVPGRIDHMAYDPATKRLFIAALENGSLEVLDLASGQRVRSITGLSHPQGAAIVPGASVVVVACGGDGTAHIYDTRTLEEKRTVNIGPDADNVRYDTNANRVLISYGESNGAVAILDASTWNKVGEITFPSKPESFQLDAANNRLFANLPDGVRAVKDGSVAVVNYKDSKIESLLLLDKHARNFPMAFDPVNERLFVATRRPARLIEIDVKRRAIIAESPCIDDSDDLFFDASNGRVYVIGGGFRPDLQDAGTASPVSPKGEMGAIDVFSIGDKGTITRLGETTTALHARTGLFVPALRALYIAVPQRDGRPPEIREYLVR